MEWSFTRDVKYVVADTYLAYASDFHGADAFTLFVSGAKTLPDVRRDPRFSAFTDEELIDEMLLLERDIHFVFRKYIKLSVSE